MALTSSGWPLEGVESPECYSALVREYMCVCIKIASFVSGHTFWGRSLRTLWGYFSDVVPTESCLGEVQPSVSIYVDSDDKDKNHTLFFENVD